MSTVTESSLGRFVTRFGRWVNPWVARHPALLYALRALRARLPLPRQTTHGLFMEAFGEAYPQATFIQVGANDGSMADPLRRQILKRKWVGIMVEPVPHIFAQLSDNYRYRRNLILENAAIAPEAGEREFYSLKPVADLKAAGLPAWYSGLGSFYKDIILSHKKLIPDIEERVVTQKLPCVTLNGLCDRHGIHQVNLIQIDTEGYDYEIVKLIDFRRLKPQLIVYEHYHLSKEDRAAAEALLHAQGYVTTSQWLDTLALHLPSIPSSQQRLLDAWKALQADAWVDKT